jgi:hypothetical protein
MINGIAMQFRRAVLYHHSPLDELQCRALDFDIIGFKAVDPETIYSPGQSVIVWTASMLCQLPFMTASRWWLLMSNTHTYLNEIGNTISEIVNPNFTGGVATGHLLHYQLAFVDGRYATWTGTKAFLDLKIGETVEELPKPALESLSYNLTELTRRELRRFLSIERSLESKDAGQHIAGQKPL